MREKIMEGWTSGGKRRSAQQTCLPFQKQWDSPHDNSRKNNSMCTVGLSSSSNKSPAYKVSEKEIADIPICAREILIATSTPFVKHKHAITFL